jgi:uncharacterized protein YggE
VPHVPGSGVTVAGTGSAAAPPDVLVLQLAAEVLHPSASAAFSQAGVALAAMAARLRAAGVAPADLRTSGVSLWSQTDQMGRPSGHRASQQLTVTLRDLAAAGDLIGEVVSAGGEAARLHGLAFEIEDSSALAERARALAFADARAKAEQYAALAGRTLGPVRRVSDAAGQHRPMVEMTAMDLGRSAASMPIEAGSQQLAAIVEVEWTFAD